MHTREEEEGWIRWGEECLPVNPVRREDKGWPQWGEQVCTNVWSRSALLLLLLLLLLLPCYEDNEYYYYYSGIAKIMISASAVQ